MSYDIRFKGSLLSNIIDVTGFVVMPPKVKFNEVDIVGRVGLTRASRNIAERSIVINGVIRAESAAEYAEKAELLYRHLYSDKPEMLNIPTYDAHTNQWYILAECETYPQIDIAKPNEELQIVFRCSDPAFYSQNRVSKSLTTACYIDSDLPVFPAITVSVMTTTQFPNGFKIVISDTKGDSFTLETDKNFDEAGTISFVTENSKVLFYTNGGETEDITSYFGITSDLDLMFKPLHTYTASVERGADTTIRATWRNASLWGVS